MRHSGQVAGIGTVAFVLALLHFAPAEAQSPPSPRRARPTTTRVIVRDVSGTGVDGVNVEIAGRGTQGAVTDREGVATVALSDGTYRLRFDHDGFVTLEREVTIRNGQPAEIDVALNHAPMVPPPSPPPTPPTPPAPAPPPGSARPIATGPPANVSIPVFVEKNFIGRDPLKESVLGCSPDTTTRLLQLRDPLAAHAHAELDEILYVVAGEGAIRFGDESTTVSAGSLSVIPRGTTHAIERRGKNPLILLSTLAGEPCSAASRESLVQRGDGLR